MTKTVEFDLVEHIKRQIAFSEKTFGPGERTQGVLAHIRKELEEIEKDPHDLEEWIDVILLAIDGAWRSGASPEAIAMKLYFKLAKNERRQWPDWRTQPLDAPIEHTKPSETVKDTSPPLSVADIRRCLDAVELVQKIRCHPRRHDLEREWLTEADRVIDYWNDSRTVDRLRSIHTELSTVEHHQV